MKKKNIIWSGITAAIVLIIIAFLVLNFLSEEKTVAAMDSLLPPQEKPIKPEKPVIPENINTPGINDARTSAQGNDKMTEFIGDPSNPDCVMFNDKLIWLMKSSQPEVVNQQLFLMKDRVKNAPSALMGEVCKKNAHEVDILLQKAEQQ